MLSLLIAAAVSSAPVPHNPPTIEVCRAVMEFEVQGDGSIPPDKIIVRYEALSHMSKNETEQQDMICYIYFRGVSDTVREMTPSAAAIPEVKGFTQ